MANEFVAKNGLISKGKVAVPDDEWFYWGQSDTNGSWRFGRSGDEMVLQRRESDTWVTKHTFTE